MVSTASLPTTRVARTVSSQRHADDADDVVVEKPPPGPFLKWPGGKRWLIRDHRGVFPVKYERYIEPFLGAGSVFFALDPARAVLSDTNSELIATYAALKSDHRAVVRLLEKHHAAHSSEHYYLVRSSTPDAISAKAARFIYLNRTCFNGIYRVNRQGRFNVPMGSRDSVMRSEDDFGAVAARLASATLRPDDFEQVIDGASEGDLVFADPPYTVQHNQNGFIKYNEKLFTWEDQQRLASSLARAAARGVKVVTTNAAHASVRALYDSEEFAVTTVARFSPVAGTRASRSSFEELLVRSR